MTILYEPVCQGVEHAPFNAALLTTALAAFPHEAVSFVAEPGHARAVDGLLDRASARAIRWHTTTIAPRMCRGWARWPFEWRAVSDALACADGDRTPRIVACATTHIGLAALQAQLTMHARYARAAVIHHSGLASTLGSRSTQALLRWTMNRQIRHVVLGASIQQEAASRMPGGDGIHSLRHPYLFPQAAATPWPDERPIRFGFLGLASADKGFDLFCRIANSTPSPREVATAPRFELIGRLDAESRAAIAQLDPGSRVDIGSPTAPMPRYRYDERVRAMTYAVLPYKPQHALASSGAILDAFAHAKPCIALRTPLFEEYFRAMGDIGYLCDTEEELADTIRRIAAGPIDARYTTQRCNIITGRQIFLPARVAKAFSLLFA